MQVIRNFEKVYKTQEDPWSIGSADSPRYKSYFESIINNLKNYRSAIDLGCGKGAFLNKFENIFQELNGVDISSVAIKKSKELYPKINFYSQSITKLNKIKEVDCKNYDLIICSDVFYYLNERNKLKLIEWICNHLSENGIAFLAGWVPGNNYLNYQEFRNLILKRFSIIEAKYYYSDHVSFIVQPQKTYISFTIDYETWQPLPKGYTINWDQDIINPTNKLLKIFEETSIKSTFFVEFAELIWLKNNDHNTFLKIAHQIQEIKAKGHDIQLHFHPSWLPELGAKYENGNWHWNTKYSIAHYYPGDLSKIIAIGKNLLSDIISPVCPNYEATCFRAGGYSAQPFYRLYEALSSNNILCDSSVYKGGISAEREHNYTNAFHAFNPWYCNSEDPQHLETIEINKKIIEIPITTLLKERLMIDNNAVNNAFKQISYLKNTYDKNWIKSEKLRRKQYLIRVLKYLSKFKLISNNSKLNKFTQNLFIYRPPSITSNNYLVAIGHTKANIQYQNLTKLIKFVKRKGIVFRTLEEISKLAHQDLSDEKGYSYKNKKNRNIDYLSLLRNPLFTQNYLKKIPIDVVNILDLRCNPEKTPEKINQISPYGLLHGSNLNIKGNNASLVNFNNEPYPDNYFDCVHIGLILSELVHIEAIIQDSIRILKNNGKLFLTLPIEGSVSNYFHSNKNNNTVLKCKELFIQKNLILDSIDYESCIFEIQEFTKDPNINSLAYICAKKDFSLKKERHIELLNFIYEKILPCKNNTSNNFIQILNDGYSWCGGYAIALASSLKREGFKARTIDLLMSNHPCGSGKFKIDSHVLVEVLVNSNWIVLDPMTNISYNSSFLNLIKFPKIANDYIIHNINSKEFRKKEYEFYIGKFAFTKHIWHLKSDDFILKKILWKIFIKLGKKFKLI